MGSQASRPDQTAPHIMNFDPPLRNLACTVKVDDFYGATDVFFHQDHLHIGTFVCIICKQLIFIQVEMTSKQDHAVPEARLFVLRSSLAFVPELKQPGGR